MSNPPSHSPMLSRRGALAGIGASFGAAALGLNSASPAWANRPPVHTRQRKRELLNAYWSFHQGDAPDAHRPGFNASAWTPVNLPHTWNAEDSIDDEPGYYRGPGWYRRQLKMTGAMKGKRLFLFFEGANQVSEVWVEGQHVGTHVGGYQAFCFEITDQMSRVQPGRSGTVAVRVDNSHSDDIPPLSGDFTFYGGIYRNVWLVVTEPVHIDMLDHASAGIYVTTPEVGEHAATVHARTRVVNQSNQRASATVSNTVTDASGAVVVAGDQTVRLAAGETREIELTLPPISSPNLWSPDNPYLYTVTTVVDTGRGRADRVDTPLGLRWYSYSADGFVLNGAPYLLRGVNRHQDIVGQGNALTDEEHFRDVKIIKDMGANVLRAAHYPQAPAVLEAADELGVVVWEEAPLVNSVTDSEAYRENSRNMQVEMIRQHYNHPSVIFWGYMNEIIPSRGAAPDGYQSVVVSLAQELEDLTRAEDPARITVMAMNRDAEDRYNQWGLADIPMVAAWNLYWGWYYGDLGGFAEYLDDQRIRYPQRALWVSEYGADSDSRLHWTDARDLPVNPESGRVTYQEQSIEFQQLFNETYYNAIVERPWLIGTTLWALFEFGAEHRTGTIPHMNQKGIMHPDRTAKDVVDLYRAHWLDTPVLAIATREWDHRTGTAEAGRNTVTQPVKVYSNTTRVELFNNGVSLGVQEPGVGRTAVWQVPFTHGTNSLSAHSPDGSVQDGVDVHFHLLPAQLAGGEPAFTRLAVNAGGIVQYVGPDGFCWAEDREYTEGGWGAVGGTSGWINNAWINDSTEDPLYQTYRSGMSSYRFDVPDGSYEVTLRLTEPDATAAGQRVFGIRLNDEPLVSDLDLFAVAGRATACDLMGSVTVAGGAGLTIGFDAGVGDPLVSGIDVLRI